MSEKISTYNPIVEGAFKIAEKKVEEIGSPDVKFDLSQLVRAADEMGDSADYGAHRGYSLVKIDK